MLLYKVDYSLKCIINCSSNDKFKILLKLVKKQRLKNFHRSELGGRFDEKLIDKTDVYPYGELFYLSSFLI